MTSIYSRVSGIYTPSHSGTLHYPYISVQPPSLLEDVLRGRDQATLEMQLETERSRGLRDELGGCDCASLQMQLEAVIEQVWRCTWRPRSSELRDALGNRN
jgi:hypothetical protein